jgi:hypothetical protein
MPRLTKLVLGFIAALLCGSLFASTDSQLAMQSLNRMPLSFTKNMGQWDDRGLKIDRFLTPDGRFDLEAARRSGYQGPLDMKGFTSAFDTSSGQPIFRPASPASPTDNPDDIYWDNSISPCIAGVGGGVYAVVVYNGSLVVGGSFQVAGCVIANYIASWDGTAWSPLGSGVNNSVMALTVYNGHLIAGGWFTTAGGASASHIASWDGTAWSPLGSGINNNVMALTVYNGHLIAGGWFTTAGGTSANNIASWDGTAWSPLGSGMNSYVYALTVYNGNLIAGGYFTTAGGTSANRIASWNGTSWSPLGSGMNGSYGVYALTVYNGNLIAGGEFTTAGGTSASYIASWDGTAWSPLGSGMNAWVSALTVYNGHLIAGGLFNAAGGTSASYMASWNGTAWSPLGSGMNDYVWPLTVYNGNLIAGGEFTTAGGIGASYIASWDGTAWSALGSWMNNDVWSLTVYNGHLIAGGWFTTAGGASASHIASWDGTGWSPLGSGMNNDVWSLTVYNGHLIVGGHFTTAGGTSANYIASWDGTGWSPLGSGMNDYVWPLTIYNGHLIAGGYFTTAGGTSASHIASWDGTVWSPLGSGMNYTVVALTVYNGNLIAGGNFTTAGGAEANHIAAWDGAAWSPLGSGMSGSVAALTVYNGNLIAGGDFYWAGGTSASHIASWDGTAWSPLGSGMNSYVNALTVYNGNLIAGGDFTIAGNKVSAYLARYGDGAPPHIVLQPQTLNFVAPQSGDLPASQTITLTNTGGGTLNWYIDAQIPWLNISPFQGTSNSQQITVSINTTDLDPNTYHGTMTVTSSNADNSPQNMTVNYDVPPIVPVVLVHGWTGDSGDWSILKAWLTNDGYEYVFAADLHRCGHPSEAEFKSDISLMYKGNAEILSNQIEVYILSLPNEVRNRIQSIDIIGHSMGGLVSRRYIAQRAGDIWNSRKVRNLIMLGTPNNGSELASKPKFPREWCPTGPAWEELQEKWMTKFNAETGDNSETNYFAVWGSKGIQKTFWGEKYPCYPWAGFIARPNDGVVDKSRVVVRYSNGTYRYAHEFGRVLCHGDLKSDNEVYTSIIRPILQGSPPTKLAANSEAEEEMPPQLCYDAQDSVAAGAEKIGSFSVEANASVTICLFASDSTAAFALNSPSGAIFDSASTTVDSSVVFLRDGKGVTAFYLVNAESGTWQWKVGAQTSEPGYVNFAVLAVCENSLSVRGTQNNNYVFERDTLCLQVIVKDGGTGVTGLSVTATPIWNDGDTGSVVSLFDDGMHDDFSANDGIYGAKLIEQNAGVVEYKTAVRGTTSLGQISRFLSFYAYVKGISCGDANGDATVDISDAVYLIAYIFSGGSAPSPLLAGDANCDSTVDISDVVYLIAYIFSGGSAPCGGGK